MWNLVNCVIIGLFSLICFDGGWYLLHLQRGCGSCRPYIMVHTSREGKGEWPWQWPHSCECEHSCVPGRVGIPTFLLGVWRFSWGSFWLRVRGDHQLRPQMGWNVSVEPGREGGISYYFTSPVFPTLCQGSSRGMISHLCPPLWHQLWCKFGAATYDKYEEPLLCPPHVLEMGLLWLCHSALSLGPLLMFRPDWMGWWVRHR